MQLRHAVLFSVLMLPIALYDTTHAELGTSPLGAATAFSISVSPQYPRPNTTASISFLSSTLDLPNASVTVVVNGKTFYEGNVHSISIPLGKVGIPTAVQATVTSLGVKYVQSVSIQPQDVSLVSEPISSAPPLYLGKPKIPLEGSVRFVAMATVRNSKGKLIDPATLAYTWTVDDTTLADSSGIGRSSILVASPLQYRTRSVSVSIASPDGTLVGGDSVTFSPNEPTVRLYENDPLLGIRFDQELHDSFTIHGTESTLYAAPFSFPLDSPTSLTWYLNGSTAQTGPLITLRPSGSGEGSARLSLTAATDTLNTITSNLTLLFNTASIRTSFFGL